MKKIFTLLFLSILLNGCEKEIAPKPTTPFLTIAPNRVLTDPTIKDMKPVTYIGDTLHYRILIKTNQSTFNITTKLLFRDSTAVFNNESIKEFKNNSYYNLKIPMHARYALKGEFSIKFSITLENGKIISEIIDDINVYDFKNVYSMVISFSGYSFYDLSPPLAFFGPPIGDSCRAINNTFSLLGSVSCFPYYLVFYYPYIGEKGSFENAISYYKLSPLAHIQNNPATSKPNMNIYRTSLTSLPVNLTESDFRNTINSYQKPEIDTITFKEAEVYGVKYALNSKTYSYGFIRVSEVNDFTSVVNIPTKYFSDGTGKTGESFIGYIKIEYITISGARN